MRYLSILLVLAIAPAVASADDDVPVMPLVPPLPPDCAQATTIGGIVRDAKTGELLPGATIILTSATPTATTETETAITDDTGTFSFTVQPGAFMVTIYYADTTWEQHVDALRGHQVSLLAKLDTTEQIIGCYFGPPPVTMASEPHYGLVVDRTWTPVARERTSRAWIAPVADADPDRAVTAIGGGHRFTTALGVPLAFVEEVETHTLRTPIDLASGAGGAAAVDLFAGSNELRGDATGFVTGGRDGASGGGEALLRGPIVTDRAWWAGGLVATARPDGTIGGDALVRIDFAATPEHQLAVAALGQSHADGARDDWADAAWTSKLDDNHVEVRAGATAEHLVLPADVAARAIEPAETAGTTNRAGGRASLTYRVRAAGYHHLVAGAEAGGGTADLVHHADASVFAGDEWDFEPNVHLEAGVRGELRRFGDARAAVTAPRLAVDWDPTKEGRSSVFVAYQRVTHLDDGAIGAWTAAPEGARYHDEVAAGVEYEHPSLDWLATGAAVRARWLAGDEHTGLEAWTRVRRDKLSLHAGATTLDRAATLMARRTFGTRDETFEAIASARLATRAPEIPIGTSERRQAGLGIAWKHRGPKSTAFDTTLEGFLGDLGPAARLVVGARF